MYSIRNIQLCLSSKKITVVACPCDRPQPTLLVLVHTISISQYLKDAPQTQIQLYLFSFFSTCLFKVLHTLRGPAATTISTNQSEATTISTSQSEVVHGGPRRGGAFGAGSRRCAHFCLEHAIAEIFGHGQKAVICAVYLLEEIFSL